MKRRLFFLCYGLILGIAVGFSGNTQSSYSDSINFDVRTEHAETMTVPEKVDVKISGSYRQSITATNNSITFLNRTISIFEVNNTTVDAGNRVAKYGDRFFYAHSDRGFYGLSRLSIGDEFKITYDGLTRNYEVISIDNITWNEAAKNMNKIARKATYGTHSADISLMTCSGNYSEALGTDDHRLVILAREV